MAKMRTGSLQQKNGWLYFVARGPDGKIKWNALHTKDRKEAEKRAAVHLGAALRVDDRRAWLRSLVEAGEVARRELEGMEAAGVAAALTWEDLFEAWQRAGHVTAATCDNYAEQIGRLARWAPEHGAASPLALTGPQAQAWADGRMKTRTGSARDAALFKRVWRDLGIGEAWVGIVGKRSEVRGQRAEVGGQRDEEARRYRRMSVEEVRRVVRALREGNIPGVVGGRWVKGTVLPRPDLADLVSLAYHIGARRGDVMALTADNVDESGEFIRMVAGKTARSKSRPLLIPLQEEVRGIVRRRMGEVRDQRSEVRGQRSNVKGQTSEGGGERELFPGLTDAAVSVCLQRAWERAGVRSDRFGHASFHSLRATFISMMDEAGIPAHVTDAITGHAPQGMHGRYSQPGRAALMEAVKRAICPLGEVGGSAIS